LNDIERDIHQYIATVLLDGEEMDLELDTPLLEYRVLDSLNVEELLVHLAQTYGVLIEDRPPSSWSTIRKLADLVRQRMAT
jgi:geranyl diphosphate 2-C-methyltransferase